MLEIEFWFSSRTLGSYHPKTDVQPGLYVPSLLYLYAYHRITNMMLIRSQNIPGNTRSTHSSEQFALSNANFLLTSGRLHAVSKALPKMKRAECPKYRATSSVWILETRFPNPAPITKPAIKLRMNWPSNMPTNIDPPPPVISPPVSINTNSNRRRWLPSNNTSCVMKKHRIQLITSITVARLFSNQL